MKKILLLSMFTVFSVSLFSQSFSVTSVRLNTASPDSCTAISVDVTTFLGCINWTMGPATYTINGSIIDLDVNYTSSFICAGAISNPVFNLSLMNIPAGTYTLMANAYLDNVLSGTSISGGTMVVAPCSTVGIEESSKIEFDVYPNPTKDKINIRSTDPSFEVKLIDIKGSIIENLQLTQNGDLTSLDLSHLNAGVYFLEFKSKNDVLIKKVIKQ